MQSQSTDLISESCKKLENVERSQKDISKTMLKYILKEGFLLNYFSQMENKESLLNPLKVYIERLLEMLLYGELMFTNNEIVTIGEDLVPVLFSILEIASIFPSAEITFFTVVISYGYLFGEEVLFGFLQLLIVEERSREEAKLRTLMYIHRLGDIQFEEIVKSSESLLELSQFNDDVDITKRESKRIREDIENYIAPNTIESYRLILLNLAVRIDHKNRDGNTR